MHQAKFYSYKTKRRQCSVQINLARHDTKCAQFPDRLVSYDITTAPQVEIMSRS